MKQSLETSLKLIYTYLLVCIIGSLLGGVIFMVYNLCATMVAGQTGISFSGELFFHGILFYAPILIIFSGTFLILSMIRHDINNIPSYIVFACLLLLSWYVIIPLGNNYILSIESFEKATKYEQNLSSGYFRDYGDDTFYFSNIDNEKSASGIVINERDNRIYTFKNVTSKTGNTGDFTDTLVQTNVEMPDLLYTLVSSYAKFYAISKAASLAGVKSWLCFATICLSLISVIGLRKISHYRLVNALLVLYVSVVIVTFNVLGYQTSFLTPLVTGANNFLAKLPGIRNIVNPFVVLCNILFAAILFTIGIVKYISENQSIEFASDFNSSEAGKE